MRWSSPVLVLLSLVLCAGGGWAQTAPPPDPSATCEAQIHDVYQKLAREQLVQDATLTVWNEQLTAMDKKLRTLTTQYTVRRQTGEQAQQQAEQTIAQLVDQVRDANQKLLQALAAQQPMPTQPLAAERPKE